MVASLLLGNGCVIRQSTDSFCGLISPAPITLHDSEVISGGLTLWIDNINETYKKKCLGGKW